MKTKAHKPAPVESMNHRLATSIANRLMKDGNGDVATRLVLWDDRRLADFQNRGGWGRESLIDHITAALDSHDVMLGRKPVKV